MLPWKRPNPHNDWSTESGDLLAKVRADVANRGGVPHDDDFKKRALWSGSWREGRHKAALVGTDPWLPKCAWCEQHRPASRELDVEHYRPKVRVMRWEDDPPLVSNTPPKQVPVGSGYWWLAFSWGNYSLACETCNQTWKRNLFPVTEPRPPYQEGVELIEKPLLLDPGSTFRARDHFRWTVSGLIEPISLEGRATIITCGLNRNDLIVRREKVARDVIEAYSSFLRALRRGDATAQASAFKKIAELGARSSEFTGMARWFVEEGLNCAWEDLEGVPP